MGRKPKSRRDPYGAWLLHLRKEHGLSQAELSRLTGIPQRTIAHWEQTGNLPGREIIINLTAALGVSVEELLRVNKGEGNLMRKRAGKETEGNNGPSEPAVD